MNSFEKPIKKFNKGKTKTLSISLRLSLNKAHNHYDKLGNKDVLT